MIINTKTMMRFSPDIVTHNIGDVCQVVVLGDGGEPMDNGLVKIMVYPLASLLKLRDADKLLEGHPLVDLGPDDCGYIAVRPYRFEAMKKWESCGDLIGVRNYQSEIVRGVTRGVTRAMQGDIAQVSRISRRRLIRRGIITPAEIWWLEHICYSSHLFVEAWEAEQAPLEPEPKVSEPRKKKPKLKRKVRRRLERRKL
jgi:hypothetical protein